MSDETVQALVNSLIQTQIVQALNSAPEAIDKLVKAALSKEVDPKTGRSDGYGYGKVPYLEYLVGEEIRHAAMFAVKKVIQENQDKLEAEVRKSLSQESVVSAFTQALVKATAEEWQIKVSFETDEKKRY